MINDTNAYTYPLPHKCGTQTKGYQAGEVGAKTQLIPGAHREKVWPRLGTWMYCHNIYH